MSVLIPNIIHRIWLGKKTMPDEFTQFGRSWELLHPGWESVLWTDSNLPKLINQDAFDQAPSYAAKADILRYEILLQYGGLYVDTDFECIRNIVNIVDNLPCFVAQQNDLDADFGKYCYVNNAFMGAISGHPLFGDLVENLALHMKSLPSEVPASYLTGPHYLTRVLQAHPTVTIFPAKWFYPYTATERWRRYEKFPEAYAVHHWTLSDVAKQRSTPRHLGEAGKPCLSVALQPAGDTLRLRWVLEGLCLQSVSDFEVLLHSTVADQELASLCEEYMQRLQMRVLLLASDPQSQQSPGHRLNLALAEAKADRVLYLDSDCLPDRDVVEYHARHGSKTVLIYSHRRIYPAEKLFPYRDAVDYAGLFKQCVPERRGLYIIPSAERWKDAAAYCFSVPKGKALELGGFNSILVQSDITPFARKLADNHCPTVPAIYGTRVTWLGPVITRVTGASTVPSSNTQLRLNELTAKLHKRDLASSQGINGKSPYVLQMVTFKGVRQEELSALRYHLLKEFESPQTHADAIINVTKMVSVDQDMLQRLPMLCVNYINHYVCAGVLVPHAALARLPVDTPVPAAPANN